MRSARGGAAAGFGPLMLASVAFCFVACFLVPTVEAQPDLDGATDNTAADAETERPFWPAFVNGVAMIMATEIGDKTFFIAAIMAMNSPRLVVFAGAVGALAVMTVFSAVIGRALPEFLPKRYTHYASALLFLYFGFKMLKEGMESHGGPSDELTEVEEELTKKNEGSKKVSEEGDMEAGGGRRGSTPAKKSLSEVFSTSFTMTFFAEWGDRSQIATIALATTKNAFGITAGGIIGHSMCTGMAVIGGRMLAARISEKTVHIIGGSLFLVFGLHALLFGE